MKPKRKPPITAKRYDVGDGELLTVREIADILNTSYGVVRSRITKGWTGPELLIPLGERRVKRVPRTRTSIIAYTLAVEFGKRVPSVEEIRKTYPMTESAARYWQHTIFIALEKIANKRSKY